MTFKIAVLVKQVPDHEALVKVGSDGQLEIEDRYVCSFFDEIALEAALQLKKTLGDVEITAMSAGGKRSVEALRRSMAMGVDNLEQLGGDALDGADSLDVARALAARLVQLQADLVLCGKQAGDDDMAAVGPMVAELMGSAGVSGAVALEVRPDEKKISARRRVEACSIDVEVSLPAVVTAEKGLAEPHIPVVMRVMKAMRAKVETISLEDLGLELSAPGSRLKRVGYTAPPVRPEVQMLTSVDELVTQLEQRGVLG